MTALELTAPATRARREVGGAAVIDAFAPLEMLRMGRDPLSYVVRAARDHGDVVRLPMLEQVYLLSDPEDVRFAFQETERLFGKSRFYRSVRKVFGDGLVTSEGELWRRERRIVQAGFHKGCVERMVGGMVQRARDMADRWARSARLGQPRDALADMMELTLLIAVDALFSDNAQDDARIVGRAAGTVLAQAERAIWRPVQLPGWLPTRENRQVAEAIADLGKVVDGIIERRRNGHNPPREDLLQILLEARDDAGQPLPASLIRDEVLTLLVSGHETTGVALAWTFYHLAKHNDVRRQARAEATAWPETPTLQDLKRFPYLRAVVDESLRHSPPAWTVSREAREDIELRGGRVPKGATVMLCPYNVHRNLTWWSNPEAFDPGRWLGGNDQAAKRAYFPFGAGPRVCVGQMMTVTEMVIVIAEILRRLDFALVPGIPVTPKPTIVLRPTPGVPLIPVEA